MLMKLRYNTPPSRSINFLTEIKHSNNYKRKIVEVVKITEELKNRLGPVADLVIHNTIVRLKCGHYAFTTSPSNCICYRCWIYWRTDRHAFHNYLTGGEDNLLWAEDPLRMLNELQ